MVTSDKHSLAGNTDTGLLKLLAFVFMLIDHVGAMLFKDAAYIYFPYITELRMLGRIALPLYAWCLVVGCSRTRSIGRYALRLLIAGLVSQPLYTVGLAHQWQDLNILFLLFLAVLAIWGIRSRVLYSQIWAPVLCLIVSCMVNVDYSWKGLLFIILLYLVRESRAGIAALFVGYGLFWGSGTSTVTGILGLSLPFQSIGAVGNALLCFFKLQSMIWLALPLILARTETGVRIPKWLGYAFYPLHLILLALIRLCWGVPFPVLVQTLLRFPTGS